MRLVEQQARDEVFTNNQIEEKTFLKIKKPRFQMAEKVDLAEGAEGYRLANPSPWHAALNMASLEVK